MKKSLFIFALVLALIAPIAYRPEAAMASLTNTSAASGNYCNCVANSRYNNLTAGTFIFSIYPTTVANSGNRIASKNVSGGGWEVNRVATDGTKIKVNYYAATTNGSFDSVTGAVEANKWQYFAITFDGSTSGNNKLYKYRPGVDTVKSDVTGTITMPSGTHAADSSQDLHLMADSGATPGNGFGGRLGHFMIFNKVLTSGEIDAQLEKPHQLFDQSLKLWVYPGSNGTGTFADYSGQTAGAVCTVVGSLTLGDNPPLGFWY